MDEIAHQTTGDTQQLGNLPLCLAQPPLWDASTGVRDRDDELLTRMHRAIMYAPREGFLPGATPAD